MDLAEAHHHGEIDGIGLQSGAVVFQGVLEVACAEAPFAHFPGAGLRFPAGRGRLRRQAERRPDGLAQLLIGGFERPLEQRHGCFAVAAVQEQQAELGGGQIVFWRLLCDDLEFRLGLLAPAHFQQQVSQLAPQLYVLGIECEGLPELAYVWIAQRQHFTGFLGRPGARAAGSSEQRREGFLISAIELQDAPEIHQQRALVRAQPPGVQIVFRRQSEQPALFGQPGQFEPRAEVARLGRDHLGPALNPLGERAVDVLEALSGLGADCGVRAVAQALEKTPGLGRFPGLVAEKSVLQSGVLIRRIQPQDFGELVARRLGLPHLQIGVGEILAKRRARRCIAERLKE